MKTRSLPQTDSIQALAQFWDTNDITVFEDQLEEVAEPVFERAAVIPLRLAAPDAAAVRKIAQGRGLADAELIRSWVLEKLHGT